jgi:hypothetical protein
MQGSNRVIGNRKGVFTREREPKAVVYLLRERWSANPETPYPPITRWSPEVNGSAPAFGWWRERSWTTARDGSW